MMRLLALSLPLFLLGCRGPEPVAAAAPTPKAHMNMLQLMRAFPFPHSNVLFDTQSRDPIGPEKKQSMVFSVYRWQDADTYAGWEGVENSALALAEMAPMLLTPRVRQRLACAGRSTGLEGRGRRTRVGGRSRAQGRAHQEPR